VSLFDVPTGPIALTASTTKHLWLLASPATTGKPIKLTKFHLGFDGASAVPSIRWQIYRVTTIGTPVGTTATPVKYGDSGLLAALTTALTNLSTPPTAYEVLEENYLTPFGGTLIMDFPDGKEPHTAANGQRLGCALIIPAGVACNTLSTVVFNEA
jgi:hypothetical protein